MVICQICNAKLKQITNTHLRTHGVKTNDYKIEFPNSIMVSKETVNKKSIIMLGKNKGRQRPDAKNRMDNNNPMKNTEVRCKMGKTRRLRISEGKIKALDNLGHLPTEKEMQVMEIFRRQNFPLTYVGDGQVWIKNHCPDFIYEPMKIVIELDLNCFSHEEERKKLEQDYWDEGYKLIWLTTTKEQEIVNWLNPFFAGLEWEKIQIIETISNFGREQVYNFECFPNNNYFAENILVHNCFADSFRASLYTSFFDNSKHLGLRACSPSFFRSEMDKLLKSSRQSSSELQKAINMRIPIRLGIRFEDFLPIEGRKGVSLDFLSYLKDLSYPVMINTKSSLIGREDYVRVLSENKGGSAVHVTAISADDQLNQILEPGAPSFFERVRTIKNLTDAEVRVVARIEPFMIFVNDEKDKVDEWIKAMRWAGVKHITLDTYSWSATTPGIRRQMEMVGVDYDRMFLLMSDSQWLGSLLLSKFMEYLREHSFSCSTFDFGNVPYNDQDICCEVGDWFAIRNAGFSFGNTLMAIRYIQSHKGNPVIWGMFDEWVDEHGGWLSETLRQQVLRSWNLIGNEAYFPDWAKGVELCGTDWGGFKAWRYQDHTDFREEMLESLINS